jgi:hypothetical protein
MNKFYVYALLDERKPGEYKYEIDDIGISFNYKPFYIGKGTGSRIVDHEKRAKDQKNITYKDNKIRKIWSEDKQVIKSKILDHLEEDSAFDLEIQLIKEIKRKNEGGPLVNLTEGGEGLRNPSPEVRKKISDAAKIRVYSEETRAKLRNNWFFKLSRLERIRIAKNISLEEAHIINNEIIQKTIDARTGAKHSEEVRKKMSMNMKGIKKGPITEEHRKNLSISLKGKYEGPNNPMFGKNFRDNRVEKYGSDVEQKLEDDRIKKINNTMSFNKKEAEEMFPGTPYNVYIKAYASYKKGISKEEALKQAIDENLKNNEKGKINKIKKDVDKFYKKLESGTLNPYKRENYDLSLYLLELRKVNGQRESQDEINDLNIKFKKKLTINRMKELEYMINFYGIK